MTILVTGSSSYIAKNLINELRKKNIKFIGIDLKINKKSPNFVKLDISKHIQFKKIKNKKIKTIIHLAAISNDKDAKMNPSKCYDVNLTGTINLIKFANSQNIRKFIFASTEWVYENSKYNINSYKKKLNFFDINNYYASTKFLGEEVIKSFYRFKFCILRFGIIYGKRIKNYSAIENIANFLIKKNIITIGSKKTLRSFIHIEDVVQSLILSMKIKNNCTVDIQGPNKKNLEQVIDDISKILRKKVKIIETDKAKPSIRNVTKSSKIDHMSWQPKITILKGLKKFYNEFE